MKNKQQSIKPSKIQWMMLSVLALVVYTYWSLTLNDIPTGPLPYQNDPEIDWNILPKNAYLNSSLIVETQVRGHVYLSKPKAPLLIIMHGNHPICENSFEIDWERCTTQNPEIQSDLGYTYLANHFVKKGYAVLAPSFNKNLNLNVNIKNRFDINARANLVLKTIVAFQDKSLKIPGINVLDYIDFDNIAIIGHSRGGEACRALEELLAKVKPSIKVYGLFEFAPTDFGLNNTVSFHNPGQSQYLSILGTCEGDVMDFSGSTVFERAQEVPSLYRRSSIAVVGANHNFFNTNWSPSDTLFYCPNALFPSNATESVKQQEIGLVFLTGFIDAVFNDLDFDPLTIEPPKDIRILIETVPPNKTLLFDNSDLLVLNNSQVEDITPYVSRQYYQHSDYYKMQLMDAGKKRNMSFNEINFSPAIDQNVTIIHFGANSTVTIPLRSTECDYIDIQIGSRMYCGSKDCEITPTVLNFKLLQIIGDVNNLESIDQLEIDDDYVNHMPFNPSPPSSKTNETNGFFKTASNSSIDLTLSPTKILLNTKRIYLNMYTGKFKGIVLESSTPTTVVLGHIFGGFIQKIKPFP